MSTLSKQLRDNLDLKNNIFLSKPIKWYEHKMWKKQEIISEIVRGKVPRPRKKTYLFLEQIKMYAFREEQTAFIVKQHANVFFLW